MTAFTEWNNFYVIVGSTAGALTGLQFVAITLIADMPSKGNDTQAGEAFSTPTVVHFATVVLLTALLSAPWRGFVAPALSWALMGVAGVTYTLFTLWRMRRQDSYQPVVEDWVFHVALPLLAYTALAAAAPMARSHLRPALFQVAAVALLLLLIGLHNAWDNVMYLAFTRRKGHHG